MRHVHARGGGDHDHGSSPISSRCVARPRTPSPTALLLLPAPCALARCYAARDRQLENQPLVTRAVHPSGADDGTATGVGALDGSWLNMRCPSPGCGCVVGSRGCVGLGCRGLPVPSWGGRAGSSLPAAPPGPVSRAGVASADWKPRFRGVMWTAGDGATEGAAVDGRAAAASHADRASGKRGSG